MERMRRSEQGAGSWQAWPAESGSGQQGPRLRAFTSATAAAATAAVAAAAAACSGVNARLFSPPSQQPSPSPLISRVRYQRGQSPRHAGAVPSLRARWAAARDVSAISISATSGTVVLSPCMEGPAPPNWAAQQEVLCNPFQRRAPATGSAPVGGVTLGLIEQGAPAALAQELLALQTAQGQPGATNSAKLGPATGARTRNAGGLASTGGLASAGPVYSSATNVTLPLPLPLPGSPGCRACHLRLCHGRSPAVPPCTRGCSWAPCHACVAGRGGGSGRGAAERNSRYCAEKPRWTTRRDSASAALSCSVYPLPLRLMMPHAHP